MSKCSAISQWLYNFNLLVCVFLMLLCDVVFLMDTCSEFYPLMCQ